jgi:hypothetical protein
LIPRDLLLKCADRGVEGSQAPLGGIPPKREHTELVALMLAPGFGSIHDWIAGGKGRKHHDQPIVLCSSHTEATSVVRADPGRGRMEGHCGVGAVAMAREALMIPPGEAARSSSAAPCGDSSPCLQVCCDAGRMGLGLALVWAGCPPGLAQAPALPAQGPTVALMAGQTARALQGSFNTVPVLHSNQPEAVNGPGILIDTSPGIAYSETGLAMANPTFRFEGPFGLHFHHLYSPSSPRPDRLGRRPELSLAAVVINPSGVPVRLRLFRGAVRNSFAAPYRGHQLLGVKPLGPRPWNTGPGDATAVQMLRGRLDPDLPEELTVPPRSRLVLLRTDLPALGVVNGMLRGESDGPFHLAMVAAPSPATDEEIFSHLDSRRLAPGRTYLTQLEAIKRGLVFSRVSGVALGDTYQASLSHDLERQGPLHVPLTSTVRQSFGTGEIQVNRLVARMLDSALENVGTYGVRFDVDFLLRGSGAYAVVLSHPEVPGSASSIAFRGSLELKHLEEIEALHVGLRSGESLTLTTLALRENKPLPLQLSLVQPADSIPGHLLSIVPIRQLPPRPVGPAPLQPIPVATPRPGPPTATATPRPPTAKAALPRSTAKAGSTPPAAAADANPARGRRPGMASASGQRALIVAPPLLRPSSRQPLTLPTTLSDRYRQALEAQERLMRSWLKP